MMYFYRRLVYAGPVLLLILFSTAACDVPLPGRHLLSDPPAARPGSSILEPWYSMDGTETFISAIRQ